MKSLKELWKYKTPTGKNFKPEKCIDIKNPTTIATCKAFSTRRWATKQNLKKKNLRKKK